MNIAPDEHVQPQLMFDYDGKRDRWNGYNPEEHMKIVEEYSKVDLVCRHSFCTGEGLGWEEECLLCALFLSDLVLCS